MEIRKRQWRERSTLGQNTGGCGIVIADKLQSDNHAHLLAAAPELLEVCEKVAALNRDAGEIGEGMLCQLVDAACAAIAKAKGEAV
jgi:hypothetical protein